jgi:hypothetical protein
MEIINDYNNDVNFSSCNLIVIDNFYKNPMEVRNFALSQEFKSGSYFPGKRTRSFATIDIKNKIQNFLSPFGGKITHFDVNNSDNGAFQITTSQDRSWIHYDNNGVNWAGIVYLTPNAPTNSGTNFYKYKNGVSNSIEHKITNTDIGCAMDYSNWEIVDKVGNVFNRLILYNSSRFHQSGDYFGTNLYNGRLFQVFFFKTEF